MLGVCHRPHSKGFGPVRLPSLHMFFASPKFSPVFPTSRTLSTGFPHFLLGPTIPKNDSWNSVRQFIYHHRFLIKKIKWTARQRGTWSLEGSQAQELCPHGVGVCLLPCMWMCSPVWKPSYPCHFGDFREVHYVTGVTLSLTLGDWAED